MDRFAIQSDQDGVIARRQFLDAGGTPNDIERLLRRRIWAPLHRGVYVDHTGPPTWRQWMWAAHLCCPESVIADETVLSLSGLRPPGLPIHLGIQHSRKLVAPDGVILHRIRDLESRCVSTVSPPRLRLEVALVRVAGRVADPAGALSVMVDAVRSRRTTTDRLLAALRDEARMRHRTILIEGLADADAGIHSMLERAYHRGVEQRHGLPLGVRQSRSSGPRVTYRDVEYVPYGLIVELDGAIGHSRPEDRSSDMQRDLRAAAEGLATIRLSWHQVNGSPCATAGLVGRTLASRGWPGKVLRCGSRCPANGIGEGLSHQVR
jgi:hypothetical protein